MIRQDKKTYEHEVSQSDLHLEERNGSLNLYVPHDEAAWDDCFLHALPLRLLSWMMAPPDSVEMTAGNIDEAALGVVIAILTCSESAVSSLLKRKGVPELLNVSEEPLLEAEDELILEAREALSSEAGEQPQISDVQQVRDKAEAWWELQLRGELRAVDEPQVVVDKSRFVGEAEFADEPQVMDARHVGEQPQIEEELHAGEEQQPCAEALPIVCVAHPTWTQQISSSWLSQGLGEAAHSSTQAPAPPPLSESDNGTDQTLTAPTIDGQDNLYEGHEQRRLSSRQDCPVSDVQEVQGSYQQLLASAITMAGRVARRYSYEWTDLTSVLESLALETGDELNNPFATSGYISSAPDRQRRIGAAGELFVSATGSEPHYDRMK